MYSRSLGEISEGRGEYSVAEEHYNSALKFNQNSIEAKEKLANLYFFIKEYEKAITILEELIQTHPNNSDYHATLASCFYENGLIQKAKEEIDEALRQEPDQLVFLKFKVKVLEDTCYKPDHEPHSKEEEQIMAEEDSEEEEKTMVEEDSDEKADTIATQTQQERQQSKRVYSNIRVTIFNANNVNNSANNLGFVLRRELGIHYAKKTHTANTYQSIIYYGKPYFKSVAMEFAEIMPGKQRVGRLTNRAIRQLLSVGIKEYKDIVIYLGRDCANVASWANQ